MNIFKKLAALVIFGSILGSQNISCAAAGAAGTRVAPQAVEVCNEWRLSLFRQLNLDPTKPESSLVAAAYLVAHLVSSAPPASLPPTIPSLAPAVLPATAPAPLAAGLGDRDRIVDSAPAIVLKSFTAVPAPVPAKAVEAIVVHSATPALASSASAAPLPALRPSPVGTAVGAPKKTNIDEYDKYKDLINALKTNDDTTLGHFLTNDLDVNAKSPSRGNASLLHLAMKYRAYCCVNALLTYSRINPEAEDTDGAKFFHYLGSSATIFEKQTEAKDLKSIITLLEGRGININSTWGKGPRKKTVLHQLVDAICEIYNKHNIPDYIRWTLILGNPEICTIVKENIDLLLSMKGISLLVRDSSGKTPRELLETQLGTIENMRREPDSHVANRILAGLLKPILEIIYAAYAAKEAEERDETPLAHALVSSVRATGPAAPVSSLLPATAMSSAPATPLLAAGAAASVGGFSAATVGLIRKNVIDLTGEDKEKSSPVRSPLLLPTLSDILNLSPIYQSLIRQSPTPSASSSSSASSSAGSSLTEAAALPSVVARSQAGSLSAASKRPQDKKRRRCRASRIPVVAGSAPAASSSSAAGGPSASAAVGKSRDSEVDADPLPSLPVLPPPTAVALPTAGSSDATAHQVSVTPVDVGDSGSIGQLLPFTPSAPLSQVPLTPLGGFWSLSLLPPLTPSVPLSLVPLTPLGNFGDVGFDLPPSTPLPLLSTPLQPASPLPGANQSDAPPSPPSA